MAERKEIVRQIIHRVLVAGEGTSERLQITIEWVGGGVTAGIITRPMSRIEHLSYYPLLCERIKTLAQAGGIAPSRSRPVWRKRASTLPNRRSPSADNLSLN
jgi:hypothetical protein